MRGVVLGAKGTLGQTLAAHLPAQGIEVVGAFGRQECSIDDTNRMRSLIESLAPAVVFNAAAYTDVDKAESHADESFIANAIAPEALARICQAANVRLVHYATDFVFDGELERHYDEFDPPAPQ